MRYRDRTYGETNISRWKHGWLLLRMSAVAARKISSSEPRVGLSGRAARAYAGALPGAPARVGRKPGAAGAVRRLVWPDRRRAAAARAGSAGGAGVRPRLRARVHPRPAAHGHRAGPLARPRGERRRAAVRGCQPGRAGPVRRAPPPARPAPLLRRGDPRAGTGRPDRDVRAATSARCRTPSTSCSTRSRWISSVDPLAPAAGTDARDPFDSNQAIPSLLFGRHAARFATESRRCVDPPRAAIRPQLSGVRGVLTGAAPARVALVGAPSVRGAAAARRLSSVRISAARRPRTRLIEAALPATNATESGLLVSERDPVRGCFGAPGAPFPTAS